MDHGRLLALDTVDRLISAHGGKSILIVERDDGQQRLECDDPLADLTRLNRDGGLRRFRLEQADLETVFLNLTGRHRRD